MTSAVLLDTCAIIYLAKGQILKAAAYSAVDLAVQEGTLLVSPVSAWEIGLLHKRGRLAAGSDSDPLVWFERFIADSGATITQLTWKMAIGASTLPEGLYADPADRMLVSTARMLGVPLITSDGPILTYAAQGHVGAVEC